MSKASVNGTDEDAVTSGIKLRRRARRSEIVHQRHRVNRQRKSGRRRLDLNDIRDEASDSLKANNLL
ncbi:hypothetical protein [Burkholderia sp. 22PA0106]|uniref:hypothetical protein n=1 Tax=Burkholderia sp. 22PA0106 TaxID=3237371 RepID=UPI0039C1A17D